MFYFVMLEEEILVHPKHFGRDLKRAIKDQLYTKVEGKVNGQYGHIISVVSVEEIGECEIVPGRGHVICTVKYKAIAYMPFPGEVVDGVVKLCMEAGIFVQVGPQQIFIFKNFMPHMTFDGNVPCYRSENEDEQIRADDGIRLEIVHVLPTMDDIRVTGSLANVYLGSNVMV
eukprot:m.18700 g.18700  ORF g.18700 m.18700 type:complete len:172 (+) comp6383_c0_seq2:188-703(+)